MPRVCLGESIEREHYIYVMHDRDQNNSPGKCCRTHKHGWCRLLCI